MLHLLPQTLLGVSVTRRATMFRLSPWILVHFHMVCLTSLRSFRLPSQMLALMLALDLGELHLLTLLSHLVVLIYPKQILMWEVCLFLTPGLTLLQLDGTTQLAGKFRPISLSPRCRFRPILLA